MRTNIGRHRLAQRGIFRYCPGAARRGDVESLARRHQRDGAPRDLRVDARDRHMALAGIEDQVAMDLVGHDHAAPRLLCQAHELIASKYRAPGVLRVAEVEQARFQPARGAQRSEIE